MAIPLYKEDIVPAQNRAEITEMAEGDIFVVSKNNELKKITKDNVKETLGINSNTDNIQDLDTNKADKSELLALGEVTGTAYDGAKGKANADAIATVDSRQDMILENKVINGGDEVASGVGAYGVNLGDTFLLKTGSVYYVQVQTKYTTTNEIPTSLLLTFSGGVISWFKYSPAENTYYKISGNYTSANTNTKILTIYAVPSNAIDGVTTYAKEGMVLNLTDIFCGGVTGTGKEPNAKLMQKFIEQTGYFNDFHTMTNKEIALAYSEYLKDIDTAITELGGTI